jgi:hypothetical protein
MEDPFEEIDARFDEILVHLGEMLNELKSQTKLLKSLVETLVPDFEQDETSPVPSSEGDEANHSPVPSHDISEQVYQRNLFEISSDEVDEDAF